MSLETWKQEFYPITASNLARTKGVTALQLIDHSILKWTGALDANLAKHSVEFGNRYVCVVERGHTINALVNVRYELEFNSSSCALCRKYDAPRTVFRCAKCPLYLSRNGTVCYDGTLAHPEVYGRNVPPVEMVKALKKARTFHLKQIG